MDKLAHDFRLLFLCNPIPQAYHKGGIAVIIPYDSIELKGGETFHDAQSTASAVRYSKESTDAS